MAWSFSKDGSASKSDACKRAFNCGSRQQKYASWKDTSEILPVPYNCGKFCSFQGYSVKNGVTVSCVFNNDIGQRPISVMAVDAETNGIFQSVEAIKYNKHFEVNSDLGECFFYFSISQSEVIISKTRPIK